MPCIARLLEKGTVNRSYCCPYQGSTNHLKGLRTSRVAPRFTQPCSRNWLTVLSFFVDKTMQPTRSCSCQHVSSKMNLGRLVGLFFGYRTRSVVCISQSAPLEAAQGTSRGTRWLLCSTRSNSTFQGAAGRVGSDWHLKYPFSFLCPSSCAYIL